MTGLPQRLLNFLGDEDRAFAALFGAEWWQTISGSAGRAAGEAGGKRQWWGPLAVSLIESLPCFPRGHCAYWAGVEAKEAAALEPHA